MATKAKKESIVDKLEQDHREVEKLFGQICDKKYSAKREKAFKKVRHALTVHADAEEKILYPRIENVNSLKHIAFESYEEHALVRRLLGELDASDSRTDTWMGKMTVLKELVEHHVKEEESDMFPKLRKALGQDVLDDMTEEFLQFTENEESDEPIRSRFPMQPEIHKNLSF